MKVENWKRDSGKKVRVEADWRGGSRWKNQELEIKKDCSTVHSTGCTVCTPALRWKYFVHIVPTGQERETYNVQCSGERP